MTTSYPAAAYFANFTEARPTELAVVLTQFKEPYALKIVRGFIFALVILASILGNALIIKAVFENSLHKPLTHYLVSNMAVAELIGTVLTPFSYAYQEIFYWPFGELLCHLISPVQITSVLVTTTTLTAIAVHRYKFFTSSVRRRNSFRSIVGIILIIWTIAVAIAFPSFLFSQRVTSTVNKNHYWCLELFPGDKLSGFPSSQLRSYYMVRFCCNYLVSICTMVVAYGSVSLKLQYHRNRSVRDVEMETAQSDRTQDTNMSQQQQGSGTADAAQDAAAADAPQPSPQSQDTISNRGRHNAMRERRKRKAISGLETDLLKMIYAIILIFLFCYFPFQIFFLLEYFGVIHFTNWKYFDVTRIYVFLLTCFPSALHPICYGTMSKFFARTFSRLVLCRWSYGDRIR